MYIKENDYSMHTHIYMGAWLCLLEEGQATFFAWFQQYQSDMLVMVGS